jgi:diguanylate cyclase (GGDEF)-like protein
MPQPESKILIVDDQPENIRVLIEALKEEYATIAATSGAKAKELACKHPQPDLILLDVVMPDISGYQLCEELKQDLATRHIPIIFVTGLGDAEDEAKGFSFGGADYIIKPINPIVVRARIKSHLTIVRLTQQLQGINELLEQKVLTRTVELEKALKKIQQRTQELHRAVYTHALTGLPSRASLIESLQALCDQFVGKKKPFALIMLDFVRFSLINNSLGHALGDQALTEVARRLQTILRQGDVLYQTGGDEFCFLTFQLKTEAEAAEYAEQILASLSNSIKVGGHEIFVHACMGIVTDSQHSQTPIEILRDGDTALQRAKAEGTEGYYIFQSDLHEAAIHKLDLENALNHAIKNEEFLLFYQPIINLNTNRIDGFEALIRWQRPNHGIISPEVFIPCLEETGMIVPVGKWVLQQAIQQLVIWQAEFGFLSMSVNLATRQLNHPNFLADLDLVLQAAPLYPGCLKLEVTESGLIENQEKTLEKIHAIRERGLRISIDDFGTGYSSLSYLKQLPVDILKIDRCFIKDIGANGENSEIAKAILYIGDALGMSIIAEGCETQAQVDFLRQLNCPYAQGYLFAKPMSSEDATHWLQSHRLEHPGVEDVVNHEPSII